MSRCVRHWAALALAALGLASSASAQAQPIPEYKRLAERGNRSINVVTAPRVNSPFELQSAHADGKAVGLDRLTQQIRSWDGSFGTPIAAVNGDFYKRDGSFAGDTRGIQVVNSELISGPKGGYCLWTDAIGEPHIDKVVAQFQAIWPGGQKRYFGLNENRSPSGTVLYTPALGPTTRTSGGREYILVQNEKSPWLPLRPGKTYQAKVLEARDGGNSPIPASGLVLSIGPRLRGLPALAPGDILTISTATSPDLRGARMAIGGGPPLLRDGKRVKIESEVETDDEDSYQFSSMFENHPRSAVGWNDESFFLVTVDGRQSGASGMTLDQLSACLARMGCQNAITLDGGGSATLWFDGRIRNQPCDGRERAIANSVLLVQKNPKAPKLADE